MVNIINEYIHEYDFPYHDYLKTFKKTIIDEYLILKKQNKFLTDTKIPEFHPLSNRLIPLLNNLVNKNYWVNPPLIEPGIRIYIQNNQTFTSYYHNHNSIPGLISGVFYLDPPKNGGEIKFLINPDGNPNDIHNKKEVIIKPKKNKLYLFPYWMYHAPLPQTDEEYRVCFNWSYGDNIRPTHKATGMIW